jgi:hypothetical protein
MTGARAVIRRQPLDRDAEYPYPWQYAVEHEPPQDDAYDYGAVRTFTEAVEAVEHCLRAQAVTR